MSGRVRFPEQELELARSVDVVVAGGGSAGCAAALAAARQGLRTLLVDDMPFLGGMSTGGAVGTFCGFYLRERDDSMAPLVGGIPLELANALLADGFAYGPVPFRDSAALPYVPWGVKRRFERLCAAEPKLEVLLHARLSRARFEAGAVRAAAIETRSGTVAVEAAIWIDATGDAVLTAACGLPLERRGELQYASMMFAMQNVDTQAALGNAKRFREIVLEGFERGEVPRKEGNLIPSPRSGEVWVALSRVSIEGRPIDGADPFELTRGEMAGREQAERLAAFLHERMPGFERAFVSDAAPRLGIRETRHVRGLAELTGDDVLGLVKAPDGIGRSAWPIELHAAGGETRWQFLPRGEWYTIPFRCLVPAGATNLLAVGRCLSATREGFASVRVIGPCMLEGQAAGVAARLALEGGTTFPSLDIDRLRAELGALGVPL
jgi:hypothetical protein